MAYYSDYTVDTINDLSSGSSDSSSSLDSISDYGSMSSDFGSVSDYGSVSSSFDSVSSDYGSMSSDFDSVSSDLGSVSISDIDGSYSWADVSDDSISDDSISDIPSISAIGDTSMWSIDGLPSFLDFDEYEVHHWGMVITGLIAIVTTIAYFLVFRKNAKYRHLIPSGQKKSSYDKLDETEDEETYTYEDESPRV